MKKMARKIAFVALLAVVWSACAASAMAPSPAPVVDQQFAPSICTGACGGFQAALLGGLAQTFTVSGNGRLTGADLWVSGAPYNPPQAPPVVSSDLLVEVRSTLASLPTSTVLASGIISQAMVPANPNSGSTISSTHVDFTPQVTVTPGQLLSLTLPGTVTAVWLGGKGSSYSRGQSLSFDPTNSLLWVNTGNSFYFRTFITK
jgi:hypothetical protein